MGLVPLAVGLSLGAAAFAARVAFISITAVRMQRAGLSGSFNKIRRHKGPFLPEINRKEAALILGVKQSSSDAEIKQAHRKIMLLNHPDRGGSKFIATKVNEAKDFLLKRE